MSAPGWTYRALLAILCVLCGAGLTGAAGAPAAPAATSPGGEAIPGQDEFAALAAGADQEDRLLVERIRQADEQEQGQTRTDLVRLANAWADAGGRDGYPFWEKAWRRYQQGQLAGSTLRDYTVAYRDVMRRGGGAVSGQDVDTDGADAVRERLTRALRLRVEALSLLAEYLERRTTPVEEGPEAQTQRLGEAIEGLDASYRQARLAMNLSQAALGAAGREPLAESSFL